MSTDLVGRENLPNVYIKQIGIEQAGRGLIVSSMVHLYDIPDGSWYQEEDLKTNMKVLVVLSSNESFNQQIVRGRSSLTAQNLKSIDGYNKDEVKHKVFPISAVNRAAFENPLDNGHIVFPYKCAFRTKQVRNLSLFAVCFLDTRQFSSENDLELSTKNVSLYHGAVVGEQVIVNGETPLTTNTFSNGANQHLGPVYNRNGVFVAGSSFSPTSQNALELSSVSNSKIKDYRLVFKQKRRNRINMNNKPVFSDLYPSVDGSGAMRASFELDMDHLYLQTSAYAKLLLFMDKTLYNTAVEHISLSDVTIYSQRVVERLYSSKAGTKKIKPVPSGHRRKVISSKETTRGVDTAESNFAKIQEIDIDYGKNSQAIVNDRNRRTICFSQAKSRYTRGKLMYSVEVAYKDPSEKIILDIIRSASEGLSTLRNYRQRAKRLTNYNYYADETKRNLYSGTGSQAWRRSIKEFMYMYTLMFDVTDVDLDRLTATLVTMLHPRTLTMKSLDWFCEKYSYAFNRLTKYFKSLNPSMTPKVKVGYVNTDMQKGKLSIDKKFEQLVDFSNFRASARFMPKSITGDLPTDLAFPVLSYGNVRAMARAERLRFFKENPVFTPQMVPHIKETMVDQLNNLNYSSYTYFSPSSISYGESNVVNLEKLETVDLKQFNKLYNIDQRRKYRAGYNPSSNRQQDILSGRKSSFYIKETKRESEDIEEYKSSADNLGSESVFVDAQKDEQRVDSPNLEQKTKDKFKAYNRAKESNVSVSFEDFDIRNQENILSETTNRKLSEANMKRALRDIPLHLKALMGSQHGFTKNNIFYGHEDLMQHPEVRDLVKTCFLSLVKIQYLEEYTNDNFRNAKWRDMSSYSFNSLIVKKNKTVLCRFVPFNSASLKVEADLFDRMGIENKYFLISKNANTDSLAITGEAVSNNGAIIINRASRINNQVEKFMNAFENNSMLNSDNAQLACHSLVVNQPSTKNGPLNEVDYREVNDLVGGTSAQRTRSAPQRSASPMGINTTSTGGGPY